jgi:hypothetical protein
MTSNSFIFAGGFWGLTSVAALFYQQSFCWVLCPQALTVMFLRQLQHGFDSLGGADFPDLFAALLYPLIIGWLLSRASRARTMSSTAFRLGILHLLLITLAIWAASFRNHIWAIR